MWFCSLFCSRWFSFEEILNWCPTERKLFSERHFPVVLYCWAVTSSNSVERILKRNHSNESYWAVHVVLFIIIYKVVQTLESVNEILQWVHSNESCYRQYFRIVGDSSDLTQSESKPAKLRLTIQMVSNEKYFPTLRWSSCRICWTGFFSITLKSVDETLKCAAQFKDESWDIKYL